MTRIRIAAMGMLLLGVLAGFFAGSGFFAGRLPDNAAFRWIKIPYRLGLDLQGGAHLTYQADFPADYAGSRSEAMASLRDVVERRVNLYGVAEPLVQTEESSGESRLIVELAGITNIQDAIRLIGETPFLEFRAVRSAEEQKQLTGGREVPPEELTYDITTKPTGLDGRLLSRASLQFDSQTNVPVILLDFTNEGAALFEKITEENIGKPLAIFLDGAPLSAPAVQEKITGGKAQITGDFTPQEARELVGRMNAGALPVPITLVGQQNIEASLGRDSLARSFQAALWGFLAVILFMVMWYRLPGVVAIFALGIYASLVLTLFKVIPVTLTAASVAGFVLSVGMAVDANVLIFERLKEELRRGKNVDDALRTGFERAWTSIRDSNVSSLITAAVLFWLGTSVVKGFALTLGIGVLVSMFSAITVSRIFLRSVITKRFEEKKFLLLSGLNARSINHEA